MSEAIKTEIAGDTNLQVDAVLDREMTVDVPRVPSPCGGS